MISAPCRACRRPRGEFPSIFKNDPTCSVVCQKADAAVSSQEKVVAPSECSPL